MIDSGFKCRHSDLKTHDFSTRRALYFWEFGLKISLKGLISWFIWDYDFSSITDERKM